MRPSRNTSASVILFESYASGSHGRIIDLLKRYSRHAITEITLQRDHWKWLALASHYHLAEKARLNRSTAEVDLLIFSGVMNIGALIAMLPVSHQMVPRVAYFHESQWSYPSDSGDPRPYLMQHLDALAICDEVWFNSRYHLDDFVRQATSSSQDDRLKRLSRQLIEGNLGKLRVVYPPVELDKDPVTARSKASVPALLWNARWEQDKRPDRFVELLSKLAVLGVHPSVRILGTAGKPVSDILHALADFPQDINVAGHLDSRHKYELALAGDGIFISTADHEFFGVAAIESVLAGNTPVLPYELAYPETLPCAWFYRHGDINDLAAVIVAALAAGRNTVAAHQSDARRFDATEAVKVWDDRIDRVALSKLSDS